MVRNSLFCDICGFKCERIPIWGGQSREGKWEYLFGALSCQWSSGSALNDHC
jgi:hypothetical protein